jgi:hypothetical protein
MRGKVNRGRFVQRYKSETDWRSLADPGHKLVRTAGLEPARGFPQGILSPLRLPFRHVRFAYNKSESARRPL